MKHAREDYNRIQDPEGKIGENEPVFLFRAKDVLAPVVLARYAELLKLHGCQQEMIDSTLLWEQKMREWQRQKGCKLPDMPVIEAPLIVTNTHMAKPEAKANFSGWVGHRAKMANGDVVIITSLTDGRKGIWGNDDFGKNYAWSVLDGKNYAGTEEYDLVELLSGPSRNRKGE